MKFRDKKIIVKCAHGEHIIQVNPGDHNAWKNGVLIQDAMPYLSAEERELLITGLCDVCWKVILGPLG